jgi:hypothetical protein
MFRPQFRIDESKALPRFGFLKSCAAEARVKPKARLGVSFPDCECTFVRVQLAIGLR